MKKKRQPLKGYATQRQKLAHIILKKNGEILNLIPDLYEAWHAGKSKWKNYNSSINIQ